MAAVTPPTPTRQLSPGIRTEGHTQTLAASPRWVGYLVPQSLDLPSCALLPHLWSLDFRSWERHIWVPTPAFPRHHALEVAEVNISRTQTLF